MIDLRMDWDIEKTFRYYERIGLFMPLVARDYNNRLAFNTRDIGKGTIGASITRRASFKYITSGRVLRVQMAPFSRRVENIEAEVGGLVVPQARDPLFMRRLEFGGRIPADRFGRVDIPTVKGARGGSATGLVKKSLAAPRLGAQAVAARNVPGSNRRKQAVAIGTAVRERKQVVQMPDSKGRMSIYKIRAKGRGGKRRASEVTKIWTSSRQGHTTSAYHWLSRAVDKAVAGRVKVFKRVAEFHIKRRALKGK